MNSTLITIPATLDAQAIRASLQRIVIELDRLKGNRSSNPALLSQEFNSTITTITQDIATLSAVVKQNTSDIQQNATDIQQNATNIQQNTDDIVAINDELDQIDILLATIVTTLDELYTAVVLDSTYYDFNATEWDSLEGFFEFTTVGDNLVNAPFTPRVEVPQISYTIIANAKQTTLGLSLDMSVVEDGTFTYEYKKVGSQWLSL